MTLAPVLQIGRWTLRTGSGELVLDGRVIPLEPRLVALLRHLAGAGGDLVSHEQLLAAVWPQVVVTPSSVYEAVARLRAVLAADRSVPAFIATVPRRGYRLLAPVHDPARHRLAVRPFRVDADDTDLLALRDRLLDRLIAALAREAPGVVLARGTMLQAEAATLPARWILEGELLHEGSSLRLHCELIDGEQGTLLASESLRVDAVDGVALVASLTHRLARSLSFHLGELAAAGDDAALTPARRHAMRAWVDLFGRPQSPATNAAALSGADAALALDGRDALAHVCRAYAAWRGGNFGWQGDSREAMFDNALHHVQRALELAPEQADAHFTRALVAFCRGDFALADLGMREAIRCAPSHAPAWGLLGRVRCVLGHPEETSALVEQAMAISPLEPLRAVWHWAASMSALMRDDAPEALQQAHQGLAVNPAVVQLYFAAIAAAQAADEPALARRHIEALRRQAPQLASLAGLRRIGPPPQSHGPYAQQSRRYRELLLAAGLPEA